MAISMMDENVRQWLQKITGDLPGVVNVKIIFGVDEIVMVEIHRHLQDYEFDELEKIVEPLQVKQEAT